MGDVCTEYAEIKSVSFSLLGKEEIRRISVKRITNWQVFDSLEHPVKNGLYDLSLGPIERDMSCETCSLDWYMCPGHFGHIELPTLLYNPMSFKLLFRLLNSVCIFCGRLRFSRVPLKVIESKILLLRRGKIPEAEDLDDYVLGLSKNLRGESVCDTKSNFTEEKSEEEVIEGIEKYTLSHLLNIEPSAVTSDGYSRYKIKVPKINKSYFAASCIQKLEKSFLGFAAQTCPYCEHQSPKYRQFQETKIFQKAYPQKLFRSLVAQGVDTKVLLDSSMESAPSMDEVSSLLNDDLYLNPQEVLKRVARAWENDSFVLNLMYGSYNHEKKMYVSTPDMFFLELICVPPNKFRPVSRFNGKIYENPQNMNLVKILKDIASMQRYIPSDLDASNASIDMKAIVDACVRLQNTVNSMYDSSKKSASAKCPPGIRQILEKKEGLIRKHMMGKRVNYSARSVISPDPRIGCDEVGIPLVFATKFTYVESVTHFNAQRLRQSVINGPSNWPGATHVQGNGALINLALLDEQGRTSIANQLLMSNSEGQKKVHRHILNGDYLLFNRQPTLHKPSIMAHTARILPNEKTMRLHYSNCNTYNADFDGDEMNAHFPQNQIARAEAMTIAKTSQQYLGPANGDVLRGLVQDHICAGVLMCSRDVLLDKESYVQLVYSSLRPERDARLNVGDNIIEEKIVIGDKGRIVIIPPAIIRPVNLWTGKQVITTIILNLIYGKVPLNLKSVIIIPEKIYQNDIENMTVNVLGGHFLTGILDKSQLGAKAHGLVHAVYETYGPNYSERLLTIFGDLFTNYLQYVGFSCRMEDLRLNAKGEEKRAEWISKSKTTGSETLMELLNISDLSKVEKGSLDHESLEIRVKSAANRITSQIISDTIPAALELVFPHNNMQVMTLAGAKGSIINVSQISALLGQQELEGKRVPVMVSGKTLTCFLPYDNSVRAGGFISDRFFTGVRPQEYFFHCMAGREGLVDTAVKTARSGYLQRCLVKHLEGIKVEYDGTVRDMNGSIIQFNYGEDSLDVPKQKSLMRFDFCAQNYKAFLHRYNPAKLSKSKIDTYAVKKYIKAQKKAGSEREVLLHKFQPFTYLGSVSEAFLAELDKYIASNPSNILGDKDNQTPAENFRLLMYLKYQMALVEPGESVGLLAAQSIGEPSTQMTLNTFHLAGFGAKNVTLGVPRLSEIIMMASKTIKTPFMKLNIKSNSLSDANYICKRFTRVKLDDIVENISVNENLVPSEGKKEIKVKLTLSESSYIQEFYDLSTEEVELALQKCFPSVLSSVVNKEVQSQRKTIDTIILSSNLEKKTEEQESDNESDKETENESDNSDNSNTEIKQESDMEISKELNQEVNEEVKEEMDQDSPKPEEDLGNNFQNSLPGSPRKSVHGLRYIRNANFDTSKNVCTVSLEIPAGVKLLVISVVEKACKAVVIREISGISRCAVAPRESESDSMLFVTTEGVNFSTLWQYRDIIDCENFYANDVNAILDAYGVEAARRAIIGEIKGVFGAYGISVNYRHLSLVADYMTFEGGYKPLNRMGMNSNPSPMSKMSFETTTTFLSEAALTGDYDLLNSASSRIMMGLPPKVGTGSFDLRHPISVGRA